MEGAVENGIPGIDADCGGACSCATCHVYVEDSWYDKLKGPSEMEQSMLEVAHDARPNSRLSCQIKAGAEIDGLVLRIPETQG